MRISTGVNSRPNDGMLAFACKIYGTTAVAYAATGNKATDSVTGLVSELNQPVLQQKGDVLYLCLVWPPSRIIQSFNCSQAAKTSASNHLNFKPLRTG